MTESSLHEPINGHSQFFCPWPDQNGFFWDDRKSSERQVDSRFILLVSNDNPNVGLFSIIEHELEIAESLLKKVNSLHVQAVCEFNDNFIWGNKVIRRRYGEAELRGKRWQIRKKTLLEARYSDDTKLVNKVFSKYQDALKKELQEAVSAFESSQKKVTTDSSTNESAKGEIMKAIRTLENKMVFMSKTVTAKFTNMESQLIKSQDLGNSEDNVIENEGSQSWVTRVKKWLKEPIEK